MATKRTGLGRGIGALIPTGDDATRTNRPVDVFFPDADSTPATKHNRECIGFKQFVNGPRR